MFYRLFEPPKNKSHEMEVLPYGSQITIYHAIFQRDKSVFTAISCIGIARHEDLKEHCKVAESRIKNYIRDGYIEKLLYKSGKEIKVAYTLTKKGKELAEKQWNIRGHYHAQTRSPYHDLALSDKYFSLPEELRDFAKNTSLI